MVNQGDPFENFACPEDKFDHLLSEPLVTTAVCRRDARPKHVCLELLSSHMLASTSVSSPLRTKCCQSSSSEVMSDENLTPVSDKNLACSHYATLKDTILRAKKKDTSDNTFLQGPPQHSHQLVCFHMHCSEIDNMAGMIASGYSGVGDSTFLPPSLNSAFLWFESVFPTPNPSQSVSATDEKFSPNHLL